MCAFAALGILGTVVSAAGSIMQGQQAAALGEAQAQSQEQQAEADRRAAAFEAAQEQTKQSRAMASARAQVATSGVTLEGSPTLALVDQAGEYQLDLETIKYGSQIRQNSLLTQADLSRMQGKQAKTAGFINAGSTMISGISELYDPNKAARFGGNMFA